MFSKMHGAAYCEEKYFKAFGDVGMGEHFCITNNSLVSLEVFPSLN